MKILAIRGLNLASLAGEFELDFQQPPLVNAGLFAICGATGAGKSTLLDTLCLALYGQTPRLQRAPSANKNAAVTQSVSLDTIAPRDARTLLRRGTSNGFAEVDFIGNDNDIYRARWSVRRAHGRGKLQFAEHTLHTLAGQRIAHTKTEVQTAMIERLGLSFEQFTRSVLLAQNDFAAFLKANDNERAELLETLTGLELYSALSHRAFYRAKDEQQRLDSLARQHAEQQPLSYSERAQLEQRLAATRAINVAIENRINAIKQQLDWHHRADELAQLERIAQQQLTDAQLNDAAAAPRRYQLQLMRTAQTARPLLTAHDEAQMQLSRQQQHLTTLQQQRTAVADQRHKLECALATAVDAMAQAEQQRTAMTPDLDRARELDAAVAALQPSYAAAQAAVATAEQSSVASNQQVAQLQHDHDQLHSEQQTLVTWLADHAHLSALARDWSHWDHLLTSAAALQSQVAALTAELAQVQSDKSQQEQQVTAAAGAHAELVAQLDAAMVVLNSAHVAAEQQDADQLANQRSVAEMRRDQLHNAEQCWSQLTAHLQRQRELCAELDAITVALDANVPQLAAIVQQRQTLTAELAQAEQALRQVELTAAEHTVALRAQLLAGEPCPVCGATAHPYLVELTAISPQVLSEYQARVRTLRDQFDAALATEASWQTQAVTQRQRAVELDAALGPVTATVAQLEQVWQTQPLVTELAAIDPPARAAWLAQQQQAVRRELTALKEAESVQRQRVKTVERAQAQVNQLQQRQQVSQVRLGKQQADLAQLQQLVLQHTARLADLQQQLDQYLSGLDGAFAGAESSNLSGQTAWRVQWLADMQQFYLHQQQAAQTWLAHQQRATDQQRTLAQVVLNLANAQVTAAERQGQVERATTTFASLTQQLTNWQHQRRKLLNGEAVATVTARLTTAVEAARAVYEQHVAAVQTARQALVSADEKVTAAVAQLAEREQAATHSVAVLQQWLNAPPLDITGEMIIEMPAVMAIDLATLRQLLAHDHYWMAREQAALQALKTALNQAELLLNDRQWQCQQHARQRDSNVSCEQLTQQQVQLNAELEHLRKQMNECEFVRRQDDARAADSIKLRVRSINQANITRRWQELNEVIGSADGKKFRNYAQQLTLDILLGYANRHLIEITPRYRLEREGGRLGLEVIDQDMGDERRSVHSLSGGESFLVALALALGLASLSSHRVKVESLFIDEGFGSLDAETLRVALDALDRLQAQGRKVGVISHLQEMTERIGVQVYLQRHSGGRSRIEIRGR
ncbi:AAA family ATPase [Rhodoferax sp. 4810]|uniref:AAA family ATPase n=1 Tax=Thiospirillum jenense TaxID=1653858 RepID=A0A839HB54_9GAMM|nr:AAA family ATPase [Thiospirillum jenense]MBB1074706.1 AAA family ATPase [Rhodoferax jenense]MBB1125450.1 AAA family ATPase [Thiospirillum jenense]